jgi:hypothetical protein
MFNRNVLAAVILAAVSSTAFALDADQAAKDRDAVVTSEKGLAQQTSEMEAHDREVRHHGGSIS